MNLKGNEINDSSEFPNILLLCVRIFVFGNFYLVKIAGDTEIFIVARIIK